MRTALVVLIGLVTTACGGGGGGGGSGGMSCASLAGAAPGSTAGCVNCTVTDEGLASDGDVGTSATMSEAAGSSGTVAVRATAGTTFPAGTPAGVIFSSAASRPQTSAVWTLNTYLSGALQGSWTIASDGSGSDARPTQHFSTGTTLPFDAIEISFSRSSGTEAETVQVYEFCTN